MFAEEEENEQHNPKTCMSQQAMNTLYEMRSDNMLCDAIITVDDGVFNVHRAILCSCSNYFRALFTTSLTDEKKKVFIPEIRSEIMDKIIDYAYLRKCSIDEHNVYELLTIADYVGMMGLVKQCVRFLKSILKPENCIGIWYFARSKFCIGLTNTARNYILKNFVEINQKSNELIQIGLDDFYDIINDDMLNTQHEETVWDCCIRWIEYDSNNRSQYVPQLMHGVRLGLLDTKYFMEKVKDHHFVVNCDDAKPLIIETLTFLYDLDMIASRSEQMSTPPLALPRLPHEVLFAIGGWSEGLPQNCIETYDTRADRWIRISIEDNVSPRAYHGTAVIGHKIYCIGGFDGVEYYNTCRVFDAVNKTWKEISPMHNKRCYVSVAELDGFVYAMGGFDGHARQSSVEKYDPKTNQWTLIAAMNIQRSDASACTLNQKIYITGGFNGQECMKSAEFYDPIENTWFIIPDMISRRSGVSCVSYKGYIYVMGGFNGLSRMNTGEKYDPVTQIWTSIREMYHPRSNFGLEIIDNMIIAVGGFNGVATISHAECYVIENDEWLEATDMGMVRSALTVNVVKELPNIKDYIHKDRERLMEERRQRMFPMNVEILENDNSSINNNDQNDNNNNNNNNNNILVQNDNFFRNNNENRIPGMLNVLSLNNAIQFPIPAARNRNRTNYNQHVIRNVNRRRNQ